MDPPPLRAHCKAPLLSYFSNKTFWAPKLFVCPETTYICTEIGCIRRSKFQPRAYVGAHNQHGGYGHSNGNGYNLLFTPVPTYSNDAGDELGLPTQNSDALLVVVF